MNKCLLNNIFKSLVSGLDEPIENRVLLSDPSLRRMLIGIKHVVSRELGHDYDWGNMLREGQWETRDPATSSHAGDALLGRFVRQLGHLCHETQIQMPVYKHVVAPRNQQQPDQQAEQIIIDSEVAAYLEQERLQVCMCVGVVGGRVRMVSLVLLQQVMSVLESGHSTSFATQFATASVGMDQHHGTSPRRIQICLYVGVTSHGPRRRYSTDWNRQTRVRADCSRRTRTVCP
jgi:hypothetical protein